MAKKIDKFFYRLMWICSALSGCSLFVVAMECTINAISSKAVGVSIPNGTEWVAYLNIAVVFFAMSYIQVERGHTVVDLFSAKYPKAMNKTVRVVGHVLGAVMCIIMTYFSWNLVMMKFETLARSSSTSTAFYVWPFAAIVFFGFAMTAVACVWCVFREFLVPEDQRCGAMVPDMDQNEEGGDRS